MASKVPRVKVSKDTIRYRKEYKDSDRGGSNAEYGDLTLRETTSKLWRSEGHPINPSTGNRVGGGPFHVTHTEFFFEPGYADELCKGTTNEKFFIGPLMPPNLIPAPLVALKYNGEAKDQDSSSLDKLGATAISQCAPTNPTSSLGTGLAETMREGVPSLYGISTWKERTNVLRGLGSEYLNHVFGWAPLANEVHSVVHAARHQRDIMQNYRHNEGRDVHRRFDFPITVEEYGEPVGNAYVGTNLNNLSGYASVSGATPAECQTCFRKETKRWFEGCFTYGGPSGADNFRRHLGYGQEADQLYGLQLTPTLLWELVPWSWAVDWFSNAGDVINNVTNFAIAGLVMRYGFMMEETIEEYYTEYSGCRLRKKISNGKYGSTSVSPARAGVRLVTKSRTSANPFGFGVGWEGLSPTQLAITAALGITRLL